MAQYTVLDRMTNKQITFEWEGDKAPTDKDMRDVFAAARKSAPPIPGQGFQEKFIPDTSGGEDPYAGVPETRQSEGWLPESFGGVPKWGLQNPKLWGLRGAGLSLYDAAVQPGVEAAGMVGGSFGSPVVGTALGYGAGKKAGEMGRGFLERIGMPENLQRSQRGVGEELVRSGVDVAQPLVMGAGFSKASKMMWSTEQKITAAVRKGIEKGIRPTVVGKRSFPQTEAYYRKAEGGVRAIVENKENLNLVDEFGELSPGLPKNLRQFTQAITQTKASIFKQYDMLRKLAGLQGAKISTEPIVKELRSLASQKHVQMVSPNTVRYALQRAKSLTEYEGTTIGANALRRNILRGHQLTPEQVQSQIKILNESMSAFYKNPSHSAAKKVFVDEMIVKNLRKSMDNAITGATGKSYQALKNKYGSVKSIEQEVSHRFAIDARKNPKGLLDFSDVFTGYHAAKGILSMDPATLGAAGAGKAVAWLYRTRNQPNRMVKQMFKNVDNLMQKGTK